MRSTAFDAARSRQITFAQLQTLMAITEAGSLVAAAEALNMTPAALTARVKGLEEAMGVTLFARTPNGLKLNSLGETALTHVEGIERAVREMLEAMEDLRLGRGGRLSVAVVSTAKYFAPRLIAAFVAEHPKLELKFLIGNRDDTIGLLRAHEADVALAGRPPADLQVEKAMIGPHPYVIIAPPTHRLAGRKGLKRDSLAGEAFLFREAGSGTRSLFDYFLGDTLVRQAQPGIELGSNETIKQAVMAGLGVALISAHTIAAEIGDGRLVTLDIEGLPIVRQWFVLHRADRPLSPAARAFQAFAKARGPEFLPKT
jgi:LysR family transcriptional regulator, low CO2-responsive transcriptional regulator